MKDGYFTAVDANSENQGSVNSTFDLGGIL